MPVLAREGGTFASAGRWSTVPSPQGSRRRAAVVERMVERVVKRVVERVEERARSA